MPAYLYRLTPFNSLILLSVLFASTLAATPTADGLYARIQTTEGTFYAQLDYDKAPQTVANFVGLATGAQAWINPVNGAVSNDPYYDGLLIPRAEAGFVIQMGSPTNTLGGGPGYRFQDEFHRDLIHDSEGILSMANSGINTNGSQFFITLNPTRFLDRKHSIFGKVVEGMSIVTAIGNLPASSVTIQNITILRIGTAASAFDFSQWYLPEVRGVKIDELSVDPATENYDLTFDRSPFTQYTAYHSTDLQTWEPITDGSLTHLADISSTTLDVSAVSTSEPRKFFRAAAASYPIAPTSINGLTINLNLTSAITSQLLSLNFTDEPTGSIDFEAPVGSYTVGATNGRIGAYLWDLSLPSSRLIVATEFNDSYTFYLKFHPDGTGTFTGHLFTNTPETSPLFGTLTWQPIP
jgi:cyclophilin family peptidyl-prolyl cis-trans isomerase